MKQDIQPLPCNGHLDTVPLKVTDMYVDALVKPSAIENYIE